MSIPAGEIGHRVQATDETYCEGLGCHASDCLKRFMQELISGISGDGAINVGDVQHQLSPAFVEETPEGALYRCQHPGCEIEYNFRAIGNMAKASPVKKHS